MSEFDFDITIFFLCPYIFQSCVRAVVKLKSLCNIPLATFSVNTPLLDLPYLGIASTFTLPLHTMGIDVPLAAFTFP